MTGTTVNGEWPCTAEEITRQRDDLKLSWKEVAIALELGVGKKNRGRYAQHAYEDLTGRSRHDSRPLGGRGRSKIGEGTNPARVRPSRRVADLRVQWDDHTDQDEIEAALLGEMHVNQKTGDTSWKCHRITVRHNVYGNEWDEELAVRYVTAFTFGPEGDQSLQFSCVENATGSTRTFFAAAVTKVR